METRHNACVSAHRRASSVVGAPEDGTGETRFPQMPCSTARSQLSTSTQQVWVEQLPNSTHHDSNTHNAKAIGHSSFLFSGTLFLTMKTADNPHSGHVTQPFLRSCVLMMLWRKIASENPHAQPAALEPRVLPRGDGVPDDGHHAGPDLSLPVPTGSAADINRPCSDAEGVVLLLLWFGVCGCWWCRGACVGDVGVLRWGMTHIYFILFLIFIVCADVGLSVSANRVSDGAIGR